MELNPRASIPAARAFWFAAIVTALVFSAAIFAPSFSVDSWSYLELSNRIFSDFFLFNTIHNYATHSPYSQEFPLLWPVLLALTRKAADLGIYTGTLLNFPICLALLAALMRLFRTLKFPAIASGNWTGAAAYLVLFGFPPFLGEAAGAQTFPLYLTLLAASLCLLANQPVRRRGAALAGLLMGIACLARFDALAPACLIGVAFALRSGWPGHRPWRALTSAAIYFGVLAVVLSPQAVYGMGHFGKPFPSGHTSIPGFLALGVLVACILLAALIPDGWNPRLSMAILAVLAIPPVYQSVQPMFVKTMPAGTASRAPLSPTDEMRRITEAVNRDSSGRPHRIVFTAGDIAAAKYGALTGQPAAIIPPLTKGGFADYARDWNITYVYGGNLPAAIQSSGATLAALDLPGLYRLKLQPEPPPTDYWMYIGAYTTASDNGTGQGIYLYKFHAGAGTLEAAGLAARRVPLQLAKLRNRRAIASLLFDGVENPSYLTFAPSGDYLYTSDENKAGTVSSFAADPHTGQLTLLNTKASHGGLTTFVAVDASGRNLLAANYDGGSTDVFRIAMDGHLERLASAAGPRDSKARAHSVTLSPDNRFAIVSDPVLNELRIYRFDAATGALSPNDHPSFPMPAGFAPRHFRFHPNGTLAVAVGEAGSAVATLQWDAQRGALALAATASTLPPGYQGSNGAAEIQIHPNGRVLYASNRGNDSIAVFRIDPSAGSITPIQFQPSGGKTPRYFTIDPTGRYLFAGNTASDSVVQFQIDAQSGGLSPVRSIHVPSPACIVFQPARPLR